MSDGFRWLTVGSTEQPTSSTGCRATYKDLSAHGVEFRQEPAERPYGVEAVFRDNSGNWFSLTQRS